MDGNLYLNWQSSTTLAWSGWGNLGNAGGGYFPYTPVLQISNLTHPNLTPDFSVGDTFQITISGAPSHEPVFVSQTPGSTQQVGKTDANGKFSYSMVEQTSNIGSYTQVWSVGSIHISPAISFMVGQLSTGGTISTTDTGQTTGGYVTGVSTISITNGNISTYSATELNDTASLYYDAQTVGTLYQDGTAILQGITPVSANAAAETFNAAAMAWDDYDLQTDHYAVAFFLVGASYENPLYLGDGSCNDASSDCTIGLGGGVYWLEAATIYLGSTLADQTNVPNDGSVPLVDDSFLSSLPGTGQPSSSVVLKSQIWREAIQKIIPALFIAE